MFGRWGICRYSKFIMMRRRLFFKSMRRLKFVELCLKREQVSWPRHFGISELSISWWKRFRLWSKVKFELFGSVCCGWHRLYSALWNSRSRFCLRKKIWKIFSTKCKQKNTANNFQSIYLGRHSGWSMSLFLDPRRISISMISLPPNFTKFDFKSKLKWFFTSCFGF